MSELESYYYDNQLRKYIVQFAAIFAGMQVSIGENDDGSPRLISVPIKNASKDRVVASVISENTQNKLVRLPIMAFTLANIAMAPERYKGIGVTRRNSFVPTGGVVPDDIKVVHQRQPVPYTAMFELGIWASNQDQHYQMIEQIMSLFNPMVTIQKSDDIFDFTRMTSVELKDVRLEENVPAGAERRIIQTTMSFDTTIHLTIPSIVNTNFIKEIYLRIGALNDSGITDSYAILADLDAQGIEYDKIFDADDHEKL